MKIECDKCSAKYSIADEKVRGKTFKIRCKKCSNVIIVRDKAVASAGGGGLDVAAPDQGDPGWHLAINGETVGPLAVDEVRRRFEAGEIDRETAVWQEGYEDWVPLADVPVFASLQRRTAARAVSRAEDPFASANQDDYAGGAVGFGAAAGGFAAAAESPRAARLTGQRNENSVLFSLDSLQSLATSKGSAPAAAARPVAGASAGASGRRGATKGLATVAPSSEGSGLIDIRALGAMVGQQQPIVAATAISGGADDAALPSFGGAGLGGLASTPLVPHGVGEPAAAAAAAAASPSVRSNLPLYIVLVFLTVTVIVLGAAYVLREPEPVIVEKQVIAEAPSVKAAVDEKADDESDEKKDDEKDPEGEGEVAEDEPDDDSPGTARSGSSSRRRSASPSRPSTAASKPDDDDGLPKVTLPTPKAPAPSKAKDVDVDCVLDPSLPKCGGGKPAPAVSKAPPAPKPTSSADPSLPEQPSQSDLRDGMAKVKDAAKACGAKHGAAPGTKVSVRVSIAGATGTVTSAAAQDAHAGTPLGNCVAAAIKKATFRKFQKVTMGAVYPITM